jgi:hypothetical protein
MLCSLAVMAWVTHPHEHFVVYFPWYTMIGCAVTIGVAWVARNCA